MGNCFAYIEYWRNGIRHTGCEILNREAFIKVQHTKGGCCMRNCAFYKEAPDQIRSDIGIYPMSEKTRVKQKKYFDMFYKGRQNVHER